MTHQPFVYCITLTCDRPEMLKRAVACFEAQTYKNKQLVIWDSGIAHPYEGSSFNIRTKIWHCGGHDAKSIGSLRNDAISFGHLDLIAHFDDDDWSAPTRLADQVAFLASSGAQVTGYWNMPFYDVMRDRVLVYDSKNPKYALGTSLMYQREFWKQHPFPDQTPEDTTWQNAHRSVVSQSAIRDGVPLMIQTVHGGNASAKCVGGKFSPAAPELDHRVREILAAAAVAK